MHTNPLPSRLSPILALALIIGTLAATCKKAGVNIPPSVATFLNQSSGAYFITGAAVTDTIPVGVTTVADKDRTISFSVSSPTGAPDTAFTLAAASITIPAGQALGYIVVKGNFGFYNGNPRKDTLIFTLTNDGTGGIAPSDFNDSFTLEMQGPCVEGYNFDPSEFDGTYNNCLDSQGGSPTSNSYQVQISSVSAGPASATLVIQNLGLGTFGLPSTDTVYLDWSNPPNLIATVPSQSYFVFPGYPPAMIFTGAGTFSSCHQSFVLNYDVVFAGSDYGVFTTMIAR